MILQENTDGRVNYTLPGDTPPVSGSWVLRDLETNTRATGSITPPALVAVSAHTRRGAGDDYDLTVPTGTASGLRPGATIRVTDSRGRTQDTVCTGTTTTTVGVAGLTVETNDSFASLWCPDISIPIAGAYLPGTGDGYALHLDFGDYKDVIYFAVTPYTLQLPLTVRTYLDYHPELAVQLTSLSRRKDWSRLCDSARDLVETRLRANGTFYSAMCATSGLKKALSEALHVILAPAYVPEMWKSAPGEYLTRCQAGFDSAIDELLSATIVDKDLDGTGKDSERNQTIGISRLRL